MKITIEIPLINEKILQDSLVDIQTWVQDAVDGKTNKCWLRMQSNWTQLLMDDPSFTGSIPSTKDEFFAFITSRDDYRNRADRDAEGEAKFKLEAERITNE